MYIDSQNLSPGERLRPHDVSQYVYIYIYNVGKTIINLPFGNGSYHLFMVIWGMVYYCFTPIILSIF